MESEQAVAGRVSRDEMTNWKPVPLTLLLEHIILLNTDLVYI
jgi:hypothetical protein